jgi:hypothetical protein
MPYTGDPASSLTDRLRLEVGDTDIYDELLSDDIYQYILDTTGDSSTGNLTAPSIIQALKYLVAKFSNHVQEKAGDLSIWDDRAEQYQDMLDKYLKDPRYGLATGKGFAGGISKSDIEANRNNPDANLTRPSEDWFKVNKSTGNRL